MSYYEPISYFENYDRYRYEHPQFPGMPMKEDDFYDLVGPTSDTQTYNRVKYTAPDPDKFSQDAFWAADPIIRGPLAEALREAEGDSIGAYDVINTPDFRDNLAKTIGKTEWNQLRAAGILPEDNLPGDELDRLALDYITSGAENVLATGAPTLNRNAGWMDVLSERYGGRPYPGGELPGFGGPGFGGGEGGGQPQGPSQTFTNLVGDEQGGQEVRSMYLDALRQRMGKERTRARSGNSDQSRRLRAKKNRQRNQRASGMVRRGARNITPSFGPSKRSARAATSQRKARARLMRTRNR